MPAVFGCWGFFFARPSGNRFAQAAAVARRTLPALLKISQLMPMETVITVRHLRRISMPKVLIADDSRFQLQLLASFLGNGFEVSFACDALQAWMGALRAKPDVILLDINMPGGTGLEVLKRLRMSTKTQHIPVVVVSGNESAETEAAARDLGAADFLHKPVEKEHLRTLLRRLLGAGPQES
jgi:PleD family two-component response regulator